MKLYISMLILIGFVALMGCRSTTPTPVPTIPPTPPPTTTPTTEASVQPTPDATSTPAPVAPPPSTPLPLYLDIWRGVPGAQVLEQSKPGLASAIIALPWVEDGIDSNEREIVKQLVNVAMLDGPIFAAVMNKAWVIDGLDTVERGVLKDLAWFINESAATRIAVMPFLDIVEPADGATVELLADLDFYVPGLLSAVTDKPWTLDGLDSSEREVIDLLWGITYHDEAIALRILDMPFLETTEPTDVALTQAFSDFVPYGEELVYAVAEKSWITDGLDESETAILDQIGWIADDDEAVALQVLDMPFLESAEETDVVALEALRLLGPVLLPVAIDKQWVGDGLNESELEIVSKLRLIGNLDAGSALQIVAMPFLDSIEDADASSMDSLWAAASYEADVLAALVDNPWVADGIDDLEVEAIDWVRNFDDTSIALSVVELDWLEDGIKDLEVRTIEELTYIANDDAELASSVIGLGWVQDGIEDIEWQAIDWVNNFDGGEVAISVVALAWVQDGVDDLEVEALEEMSYVAYDDETLASSMVGLGWVQDGVNEVEVEAIGWVGNFSNVAVASSVVALGWVQDGVGTQDTQTIEELSYISNRNPSQALRIVAMPFLETLDPPDVSAVKALSQLASFRETDFQRVLSHPTLIGGITDDWAKIVATLYGVSDTNPELIDTLLDPAQVTLEERIIELPMAGEVHMGIIRTGPGADRSMDLLEHSVLHAEEFMGVPFPTNYVGWLVGDAVTPTFGGNYYGTHIVTLPKYDVDDGSHEAEFTGSLVAHEVAHYYWSGNSNWVDEGASDFMASTSENARTGGSIEVTNDPCGYVRTIAELENLGVTSEDGADSAFTCNYALGERLFVDLYRSLDEDSFREGLRDLYLLSQVEDEDEMQDDTEVGIEHVKTAFKRSEDTEFPAVDVITTRWYDGTQPYAPSDQETGLPNPILRTINGRIHTAYLSATQEGTPLTSISTEAVDDYLWLLLRWDYNVGSDTEVPLELVHYYEDGFEFGRRTVTFTADSRHNNSLWSWWLPVGQSPSKIWAPGEYRLHVYNEDRKLVELEYEVTP